MSELIDKVAKLINDKHIKPLPGWLFILQTAAWWLLTTFNVLIGSLSVAIIGFLITEQDWVELRPELAARLKPVLLAVPYLWLLVLGLLSVASWYYFKHLGRGYRQSVVKVVAWTLGLSLMIGTLFLSFGWGERVNNYLASTVPMYDRHFDSRSRVWHRPIDGYISGVIVDIGNQQLRLADWDKAFWLVRWDSRSQIDPLVAMEVGGRIRVIGYQIAPFDFYAKQIKDWNCACGGHCLKCDGNCGVKETTCGLRNR